MGQLVDIKDLVQLLTGRIEQLCAELLPDGRREGNDWVALNPMRDDRRAGSFKVCIRGAKAGVWSDFASGDGGDALDLVAYLGFEGDKKHAFAWARRWLGLEGAPPEEFKRRARQADAMKRRRDAEAEAEAEKKRRWAYHIYLQRQDLAGTPAARYLEGRGLDVTLLPRPLRSLGFHPELWNSETQRKWPGLVAGIAAPDGSFLAVHRTWLEVQRDGRVTKAPLKEPKMTLGVYAKGPGAEALGGCIRLWKGFNSKGGPGKSLFKLPPGSAVTISEGIEDGLTCVLADPARHVLVGVALKSMAHLVLPENVARVDIAQQNDRPDSDAEKSLHRVIETFVRQGRSVYLFRPPAGIKDVNDLLNLKREEGAA